MIKKDISFKNYNGEQVTKTFYFNYTKLEGAEIELEHGDLEDTIKMLNETEDAKTAYGLFKEIILGGVGVKSSDGNQFIKSDEIRQQFEYSPAMSILIWSFIEDPESSGPFLEAMLPAEDVAAGKERLARKKLEEALASQGAPKDRLPQLEPVAPVLENETAVQIPRTDEEIMAANMSDLSNEELSRLLELRKAAQA